MSLFLGRCYATELDFQENIFHKFMKQANFHVSFRLLRKYISDTQFFYRKTFDMHHNTRLRNNTVAPLLPIGPVGPGVPSSPFNTFTKEI